MLRNFALGTAAALVLGSAAADPLFISYDNFHYSGSVTRYASLADAQAQANALNTSTITTATNSPRTTLPDARDGQVYAASGATAAYGETDIAYFSTAWYYTTMPASGDGVGNPNNSNNGFVQYYDESGLPAVTGGWSSGNTQFVLGINGGDGDTINAARLWAPAALGGVAGDTAGIFRDFHLSLTANFGSAAVLNPGTGWYESSADPSSMSGTSTGIFENQSTTDTSVNGFYAFNFSFAPGSWAKDAGATTGGSSPSGFFAAPGATVPEPTSLALVGLALAGLALRARRR